MPGDRVSGRTPHHTQESEMVQETPGMAAAVSPAEKTEWRHSQLHAEFLPCSSVNALLISLERIETFHCG